MSWACGVIPFVRELSAGNRTIILTVLISSVVAVVKPVKDDVDGCAGDSDCLRTEDAVLQTDVAGGKDDAGLQTGVDCAKTGAGLRTEDAGGKLRIDSVSKEGGAE